MKNLRPLINVLRRMPPGTRHMVFTSATMAALKQYAPDLTSEQIGEVTQEASRIMAWCMDRPWALSALERMTDTPATYDDTRYSQS